MFYFNFIYLLYIHTHKSQINNNNKKKLFSYFSSIRLNLNFQLHSRLNEDC
jgi:hypothetical protein